jgi:hypothetical protein
VQIFADLNQIRRALQDGEILAPEIRARLEMVSELMGSGMLMPIPVLDADGDPLEESDEDDEDLVSDSATEFYEDHQGHFVDVSSEDSVILPLQEDLHEEGGSQGDEVLPDNQLGDPDLLSDFHELGDRSASEDLEAPLSVADSESQQVVAVVEVQEVLHLETQVVEVLHIDTQLDEDSEGPFSEGAQFGRFRFKSGRCSICLVAAEDPPEKIA